MIVPNVVRWLGLSTLISAAGGLDSPAEFHFHPHYRSQRPLDALLLKTKAGSDEFVSEKYAVDIGAVFEKWSEGLVRNRSVQAIADAVGKGFSGSMEVTGSEPVRSGAVEVVRRSFRGKSVNRDLFVEQIGSWLKDYSEVITAEFLITGIDVGSAPMSLKTRVRYELVGSGREFYREGRVGYWELGWESSPAGDYRLSSWKALEETQSRARRPLFSEITEQALGATPSYSAQLLHGSDYWRTVLDGACGIDIYGHNGVSVGDIDDDGYDDLYICQPAGLPNRLYRNRGDGTFEDITETSGVGVLENTACALFIDVNNDGRQDLVVVRTNGPLLFLNEGNGKFRQKENAFQFANPPQGTFTGAAAADYDHDGWLDVYFCLYSYYQGTDQYKYPLPYHDAQNGPPNFMMRNNRDGTFGDVTAKCHLDENNNRYSFCCSWNDYNQDGWPDLYVVNDFGRKNLYRNNGDGTFTDVSGETAVEDVGAGMSVSCFDYDNDGAEDFYVGNMWTAAGERISGQKIFMEDSAEAVRSLYQKHAMGNSLLRNRKGTFEDQTRAAKVGMGRWSWSSDAWDFDHDGFQDLYITNGMVSGLEHEDLNSFFWRQVVAKSPDQATTSHDYEQGWNAINELIRSDGTWSGYERNVFYANNRDGTFSDISGATGLDFIEDGRSFALADFDHDGRFELCLKNRNAPQVRILKNVIENLPPSIAFRLKGTKRNRDAIGAVITIETDAGRQTKSIQAGSGFLSQHSKDVFFGLGSAKGQVQATIRWPSGLVQELHDLPPGHRIWIEEGSAPIRLEQFMASRMTSADRQGIRSEKAEVLPENSETWLLTPVAAPNFKVVDLRGKEWALGDHRAEKVLLSFWAAESQECRGLLITLEQVYKRWAERGIQVLAINVDRTADQLSSFVLQHHLTLPTLAGSDDVAGTYSLVFRLLFDRHRDISLPTSFLINGDGEIEKVYVGAIDPNRVEQDCQRIPSSSEERIARALPFPGVSEVREFPRNYLSWGSAFFQRGYYEQAGASFALALKDDPSSAEACYGIGSVSLQQNKLDEAKENFERATKVQATYPDTLPNAWNNLGLIATRQGQASEAISYFEEALKLSPDHLVALENLGNAYRQEKRWEEARITLERAVQVGPRDVDANYSLGMVYAQLNDVDRAHEYLQRALQIRPEYPEALNNLGVLYLRTQRRDEAVAKFEECIRVAPSFDQSYLNLARVYEIEGSNEKARSVLLELLKQHPDHAQAKAMLGELGR